MQQDKHTSIHTCGTLGRMSRWSWQISRSIKYTRQVTYKQHNGSSPENKLDENSSNFCNVTRFGVMGLPTVEGALYDSHLAASLAQHVSMSTLSRKGDCE